MSDVSNPGARYCPQCGRPVERSVAVATADPIDESFGGSYESADGDGHVVVEDGEIRLYKHGAEGSR